MLMYDNTKVTVELRELIENGVDIWDFDYPSYYKGDAKTAFEKKLTDHYYFRQIGQETPARFLHMFRSRMREIMPYYLQLYKSQEIMDALEDPFGNVDIVETFEEDSTGEAESTDSSESVQDVHNESRGSSENTSKYHETPQGEIANIGDYLTNATLDSSDTEGSSDSLTNNETSSTGKTTSTGKVTRTLTKKGNQGVSTYAHDMTELRGTYLNIDMQVIREFNDLFLMVY